jgi:hypothetical protein
VTVELAIAVVSFGLAAEGMRRIRSERGIGRVLLGLAALIAGVSAVAFEEPGIPVIAVGLFVVYEGFELEKAHRFAAFGLLACGVFGVLAGGYLIGG